MATDPSRLAADGPGLQQPGEASPSFAQTGAEFMLDDSDIDDLDLDLRSQVLVGSGSGSGASSEAFEMLPRGSGSRDGDLNVRGGETQNRHWDAAEDDDDDSERRRRTPSASSTVASFELYTPDEELAVRRKFDRKLVLFVALLYMLSFLDRSSTSNHGLLYMKQRTLTSLQTSATPASPAWTRTSRRTRPATTGTSGR